MARDISAAMPGASVGGIDGCHTDCSGKTTRHCYEEDRRIETIDALGQITRYYDSAAGLQN